MQFDNAAFESKIKTTIASLDELKKSLDFANASKGLQELSSSTKNFNLDGIATGIEAINSKFSAMGAIAFSTISNITNQAINAGIQLGKSLSLNQVLSGFQEYQTNINSIQTILANTNSKGTTLDDVNVALDQLNEYSDRTIYNFSQMAKNIGTFTAAGVDLNKSVGAIKGIANLAAVSGASAEQASMAMYQLSQAVATGTVRLIDWNSVQNASLGGEFFQRQLFEAGKALGTINGLAKDGSTTFEEWTKANGSFRNSLSGSGEAVLSETDKLAQANAEASKLIATAEKDLADTSENANQRIEDAKKRVSDSVTQGAQAIENASERQRRTIEDGAKSIKDAWQGVIDARTRLDRALKPASENELEAAQDRLTASQLDQLDLTDAISRAEQDQLRALDRETKARKKLAAAKEKNDIDAQGQAYFELQDAQNAVTDAADAVTRAQLSQRAAARDLSSAQEALIEVQKKGTEADQNVISAKEDLETAEQRYAREVTDSAKRQQDAANDVAQAREDSARRQEDAVRNLADVENDKVTSIERLQDRLATAHEEAAKRITAAGGGVEETWLTSDVLLTALKGIGGELSYEEARALGFADEAAKQLVAAGELGNESATSVKTLTQLLSTLRESVGSGWAQTFRTVFGTFEEAKTTFTRFNDALGLVSSTSADSRNAILTVWKTLGGRDALINGITTAFKALGEILGAIKDGFRDVFPRKTGEQLAELTSKFFGLMQRLRASPETLDKIQTVFRGFFSIIKIGLEVIKGAARIFGALFGVVSDAGGSSLIDFLVKIGEVFSNLAKKLVDGNGIADFVQKIVDGIGKVKPIIAALASIVRNVVIIAVTKLVQVLVGLGKVLLWIGQNTGGLISSAFTKIGNALSSVFDSATSVAKVFGDGSGNALGGGLNYLGKAGERLADIWSRLVKALAKVKDGFASFGKIVWDAMQSVWAAISQTFGQANFNQVLDAVNVGLFGGFLLLLGKFLNGGLGRFLVGGDIMKSVSQVFEGITGALNALQLSIKADAIMEIAKALALLTVSVVVLSLIDSASLTKAFVAIAAGLGGLVGSLVGISKISEGVDGVKKLVALTASLSLIAVAVVIMAGAMVILAQLDETGLGIATAALIPIAGFFATMFVALKKVKGVSIKDVLKASLTIIAVGGAVRSLSKSIVRLGEIDPDQFEQGLGGVIAIISGLILALRSMPKDNDKFQGLVGLGVAIWIVARVIDKLGAMDPVALGQGLGALSAVLLAIGYALVSLAGLDFENLGPALLGLAALLVAIGIALGIISLLDTEGLAKGIGSIALVVYSLALALIVMSGSITGSYALGIAAAALIVLAKAFEMFSKVSIGDILKGLLAMAGVVVIFVGFTAAIAALSVVIPGFIFIMQGLGLAVLLLGAGFALLGVGAKQFAEAFEIVTRVGSKGVEIFKEFLGVLIGLIPDFISGFVDGILQLADTLVTLAPKLVGGLVKLIIELLKGLRDIIPELLATVKVLVENLIIFLKDEYPALQKAGFEFLIEFLKGVEDNIAEITRVAASILITFLIEIGKKTDEIIEAGAALLETFLFGIAKNIQKVIDAGTNTLLALLKAMTENSVEITRAIGTLLGSILLEIGKQIAKVSDIGFAILEGILNRMISGTLTIRTKIGEFIQTVATAIVDTIWRIKNAAVSVVLGFFDAIVNATDEITNGTADFIIAVLNGLANAVRTRGPEVRAAGLNLAGALIDGMTGGLAGKAVGGLKKGVETLSNIPGNIFATINKIKSPSGLFRDLAAQIPAGIALGLQKDRAVIKSSSDLANVITDTVAKTFATIPAFDTIGDINPVISPVLDLTQVQRDAATMSSMLGTNPIGASLSLSQAQALSRATTQTTASTIDSAPVVKEIKFEQIINSPTTLSNAQIYRQTKSQIQMAQEELGRS